MPGRRSYPTRDRRRRGGRAARRRPCSTETSLDDAGDVGGQGRRCGGRRRSRLSCRRAPATADDGCSQRREYGQGRQRSARASHERTSPTPWAAPSSTGGDARATRAGSRGGRIRRRQPRPLMEDPSRHPALPPGYRLRAPSPDDAEAVAALKRAVDVDRHGDSDVTVDEVREEWALPRLNMSDDLWLVEEQGGSVVGYGLCWVEAPPREIVAEQVVAPAHRGHGFSEHLLQLGEARAMELLTRAAGGRRRRTSACGRTRRDAAPHRPVRHTTATAGADLPAPRSRPRRELRGGSGMAAGHHGRPVPRGRDDAAVHSAGRRPFSTTSA